MKEITAATLETARQNADLLSVNYTAKDGTVTERPALVVEVFGAKGLVLLETESGPRTFRISGINAI